MKGYAAVLSFFGTVTASVVGFTECPANCVCTPECTSCEAGYYGARCSLLCSEECHLKICKMDSGQCKACIKSYFMADGLCRPCPKNCKECSSEYFCIVCQTGYKGTTCSEACSNCLAGTECDKDNGYCLVACKRGLSGNNCNIACNTKCQTCERKNSDRCQECAHNTFGPSCSRDCSTTCLNSTCDGENGTCTNGCDSGYWGEECDNTCPALCQTCNITNGFCVPDNVVQEHDYKWLYTRWMTIAISFMAIVGILLFLFVVLCYRTFSKRKRRSRNLPGIYLAKEENEINSVTESEETILDLPNSGLKVVAIKKIDCQVDTAVRKSFNKACWESEETTVQCKDLRQYVQNKTNYIEEFLKQPTEYLKTVSESQRQENLRKNRYPEFCPYDENRVKILYSEDGDYINASYISTFCKERDYIACAGPDQHHMTLSAFWRMIWQENCEIIVMLNSPKELHCTQKGTCDKYWPDKGMKRSYKDIVVRCVHEIMKDKYVRRTFTVIKSQDSRRIYHFQYKDWQEERVPEDIFSLKAFQDEVNMTRRKEAGPAVVHCSAGVGATGTYIALDLLTQQGIQNDYVDIYTCVFNLRNQRRMMVQHLDQYIFVHEALLHFLDLETDAGGHHVIRNQEISQRFSRSNGHTSRTHTTKL